MDERDLEIVRLRWRVQIVQGLLVKFWMAVFSGTTPEGRQQSHHSLLAELDLAKEQGVQRLLAEALPEQSRVFLTEDLDRVVEEMKAFTTSLLTVGASHSTS